MVVKFKDSFIEADEVIFNDLSIELYVYGMGGKATPNGSSRDIDLGVLVQKIRTVCPNKSKLSDLKNKIIDYVRSTDFTHYNDVFKKSSIQHLRANSLGYNYVDDLNEWMQINSDNELVKQYNSLIEETKEMIKNIQFKDGYLDLSYIE